MALWKITCDLDTMVFHIPAETSSLAMDKFYENHPQYFNTPVKCELMPELKASKNSGLRTQEEIIQEINSHTEAIESWNRRKVEGKWFDERAIARAYAMIEALNWVLNED